MLFYFSATGNSKYVASCLQAYGERMVDMAQAVQADAYHYTITDGRVGIVSPTYDFALPAVVRAFLEKVHFDFQDKPYIFYVGTYGTTLGGTPSLAKRWLEKKGLTLDAQFGVKMPDTWTPFFDLTDKQAVASTNAKAEEMIATITQQLSVQAKGKYTTAELPRFVGQIGTIFYDCYTRQTRRLSVNKALCIGCGLCAKKCPVNAIAMNGDLPEWTKKTCVMCLGCLHRCPAFAIQYGKGATNKHGQYTHPKVVL